MAFLLGLFSVLVQSTSAFHTSQEVAAPGGCNQTKDAAELLKSRGISTAFCESVLATTTTVTASTTVTSSNCSSTWSRHSYTTPSLTVSSTTTPVVTVNSAYPSPEALFQGPDAKLRDACECLGIPSTDISTRTVTYTPTTTTTTCPTPSPCHNEGLQWAYYHFGEGDVIPVDTNGSDYNIDVSALKHTQPNVTGTTVYVNVNSTDASTPIDIYGHQEIPDFFALNHRGYLYANITGTYAVTLVNTDDVSYFWYNKTAYEGWNITNADMYNNYDDAESAHIDLVAGDYLPIRLIYANAQGAASLSFTITAPDGSEILGPNSTASPYIVQYSCDRVTAPEFPPFGNEL